MTQEEKDLLLKDLSARLPYGCRVFYEYVDELNGKTYGYSINLNTWCINELEANKAVIKPYLRLMSNMTDEEKKEYQSLCVIHGDHDADGNVTYYYFDTVESFDWLNRNMFDFRGLIPKDLAIEVTEDNREKGD